MFRSARSALLSSSVITVACGLLFASAHADVYKYKDEKGNILYTDKPMFLPAERISKGETSSSVDVEERNEAEQTAQADRDTARRSESDRRKTKETETAGKAELCNKARKDYLDRMSAQRLYEEQANGEKRFLSEKELVSARASAKQAMDALCN